MIISSLLNACTLLCFHQCDLSIGSCSSHTVKKTTWVDVKTKQMQFLRESLTSLLTYEMVPGLFFCQIPLRYARSGIIWSAADHVSKAIRCILFTEKKVTLDGDMLREQPCFPISISCRQHVFFARVSARVASHECNCQYKKSLALFYYLPSISSN